MQLNPLSKNLHSSLHLTARAIILVAAIIKRQRQRSLLFAFSDYLKDESLFDNEKWKMTWESVSACWSKKCFSVSFFLTAKHKCAGPRYRDQKLRQKKVKQRDFFLVKSVSGGKCWRRVASRESPPCRASITPPIKGSSPAEQCNGVIFRERLK